MKPLTLLSQPKLALTARNTLFCVIKSEEQQKKLKTAASHFGLKQTMYIIKCQIHLERQSLLKRKKEGGESQKEKPMSRAARPEIRKKIKKNNTGERANCRRKLIQLFFKY
jgi:hypothetical protein